MSCVVLEWWIRTPRLARPAELPAPGAHDAAVGERQRGGIAGRIGLQAHQLARAEAHAGRRAGAQQVRAQPPPAHPAEPAAGGCISRPA